MSPAANPLGVTDLVGLAAAATTTLCWLPQALKTIRTRDARSLSLAAQAAFTTGLGLWLAYGVLIRDVPLIAANAVSFALAATILGLKLRYG